MKIKTLLEEEIQKELQILSKAQVKSDEYKSVLDGITKLTGLVIEFEKVDNDKYDKEDIRYNEYKVKHAELEMERKDRLVKNCLTGASIVTGIGLTIWGTCVTFKFEETGTITSSLGRGFINRILPKK